MKEQELLTLTELGRRAGVSMPTMLRYKKQYAERIPSEGEGRTMKFPVVAVQIVKEIRDENLTKRGRPRKDKGEGEPVRQRRVKVPAKKKEHTTTAFRRSDDLNVVLQSLETAISLQQQEIAHLAEMLRNPIRVILAS